MFSTKLRTAIVTFAALLTVGFASAPIVQDASAKPNTGKYQKSSEAMKKKLFCNGLQSIHDDAIADVRIFDKAAKAVWEFGETENAKRWAEEAQESAKEAERAKNDARKIGCGWAQ